MNIMAVAFKESELINRIVEIAMECSELKPIKANDSKAASKMGRAIALADDLREACQALKEYREAHK